MCSQRWNTILLGVVLSMWLSASLRAQDANDFAPVFPNLTQADVSYTNEKLLPDLEDPFIDTSPAEMADGILVGSFDVVPKAKRAVVQFANEIAGGEHGKVDSLLVYHKDRLLFESYYRRGRANYPHFQMSITKSYSSLAIGRAIQLGHLSMSDLDNPIVSYLKEVDQSKIVAGASKVSVAHALNMHSGIRVSQSGLRQLRQPSNELEGQQQVEAFFTKSKPIKRKSRSFKYQGCDPAMTMQVLQSAVPGTAREFIEHELLEKLGIESYAWQDDVSGFPKASSGSSMRSRDMIKWGKLVLDEGKWKGEQLIPQVFIKQATEKIYTNKQGTSYGYFWWRHAMKVGDAYVDCISARGAGGQFILIFKELDLIVVVTAHDQGMVGKMLLKIPRKLLPGFIADSK